MMPSDLAKNGSIRLYLSQQPNLRLRVGLGVGLIALLLSYFLSRHLTRPVQQLANGTQKIRDGHYDTRIEMRTRDEIGKLAHLVNDLAETLETNQKSRRRWMSDTSHELRTPLTIMKSQLAAVQEKVLKMDDRRIGILLDEIDGLTRLVSDLAQLSNGDAGELSVNLKPLDPLHLLGETLLAFQARCREKQIALNALISNVSCQINGDEGRLRQLFINLLENSLRYTDAGGRLEVNALIQNTTLLLVFQDTAPGVNDEQLDKLFERFFRAEKSRGRQHGGSGLGLAICQQIAFAHDGSIEAKHSPLGGVRIEVRLPVLNKEV